MHFVRVASALGCMGLAVLALHCGGSDDESSEGTPSPLSPTSGQGTSGGSTSSSSSSSSGSSGTPGAGCCGPGGDGGGSSGGSSGTSGATPGDGCGGAASDPAAAAVVSGYIDKAPNKPTAAVKTKLVDAILRACQAFGPPTAKDPAWDKKYCWAHLAAAMNKESSFNTALVVKDGYGSRKIGTATANDPTVGLTQIRFSSTVRDYAIQGNLPALACVGCNLPADLATHKGEAGDSSFWAVTGPSANMSLMQSVECNVGLGAWYYYMNATGNGSPTKTTYLASYCGGTGTAGNLVTGLLSHLKGPDGGRGVLDQNGVNALKTKDANAYTYVTEIKALFDTMVGPPAGAHPFFGPLVPNTTQYCR